MIVWGLKMFGVVVGILALLGLVGRGFYWVSQDLGRLDRFMMWAGIIFGLVMTACLAYLIVGAP